MKYTISTYAFITLLAICVTPIAYADNDTASSLREQAQQALETQRTQMEQERERIQEEVDSLKEARQTSREQIRKDIQTQARVLSTGDSTSTAALQTIREQAQEREAEFAQKATEIRAEAQAKKEELQQKREEIRKELQANVKEQVQNQAENIIERYNAAVERLETLKSRIESRISKLGELNIDTTEATTLLTNAQAKIDTAKTEITSMSPDTIINSETPLVAFADFKAQAEIAKEALKTAHAALVDAVESLKVVDPNTSATTENN